MLDIVFTSLFTFELVWNMAITKFFDFWNNGWNIFDFIVVVFSLLFLGVDGEPSVCVCVCVEYF